MNETFVSLCFLHLRVKNAIPEPLHCSDRRKILFRCHCYCSDNGVYEKPVYSDLLCKELKGITDGGKERRH